MSSEYKPTDREVEEMDELMTSIHKDDAFCKRKRLSIREGISGFLMSVLLVGFVSAISFWNGAFNEIDAKIILFCFTVGAVMAVVHAIYFMGSVTFSSLFLITTAVCWVAFYVVF